jgi:hypothetical protein
MCAFKMNDPSSIDGALELGRITACNETSVQKSGGDNGVGRQHSKFRFTWRQRNKRIDLTKVRLRTKDYNVSWALSEKKFQLQGGSTTAGYPMR